MSPPPPPPLIKNAIKTTPQHAHCRSPTLSSRGRHNPQNSRTRPPLPSPSHSATNGVATLPPLTPGRTHHHPFSPLLPTQKHPGNAVARHRRCPSSATTMTMIPTPTQNWCNGKQRKSERHHGGGGGQGCAVLNKVSFCDTQKIQNGHQFKCHVIWIVRIEARHTTQSIVDILGRPIWWCGVGHCVAVLENFLPLDFVCIESVV